MTRTVVCPTCQFSREVSADRIPPGEVTVTCPKCGGRFVLGGEWVQAAPGDAEAAVAPEAAEVAVPSEAVETVEGMNGGEGEGKGAEVSPEQLLGVGELFERSYDLFTRRIGTLLLLVLVCLVAILAPVLLMMGVGFGAGLLFPDLMAPLLAGGGVTGGIIGALAAIWGGGAFLCAVTDEALDLPAALRAGWERYLPFLWLFLLAGFLQGGATLFFLVPGVILWVCFAFAPYMVAEGRARGMDALMLSLSYSKEDWFAIFLRLLLLWLVGVALGAIPFVGGALSLIYLPFQYILVWVLYRNLRTVRGEGLQPAGGAGRVAVVVVALLGWLLVPFIVFLVMGMAAVRQLVV
jgi:predicted Zn finger-like uncharacterized protein